MFINSQTQPLHASEENERRRQSSHSPGTLYPMERLALHRALGVCTTLSSWSDVLFSSNPIVQTLASRPVVCTLRGGGYYQRTVRPRRTVGGSGAFD